MNPIPQLKWMHGKTTRNQRNDEKPSRRPHTSADAMTIRRYATGTANAHSSHGLTPRSA